MKYLAKSLLVLPIVTCAWRYGAWLGLFIAWVNFVGVLLARSTVSSREFALRLVPGERER